MEDYINEENRNEMVHGGHVLVDSIELIKDCANILSTVQLRVDQMSTEGTKIVEVINRLLLIVKDATNDS